MSWKKLVGVKPLSSSGHTYASDPHSRIHQGRMFNACVLMSGVADNASLLMAITTPADDWPHMSVFPSCSGLAEFTIYEDAVISGGTPLNVHNHKRYSTNEFSGAVVHTPTVLTLGPNLTEFLMPGGEKNSAIGSSPSFGLEWILRNSTTYLLTLTNRSGAVARLHIGAAFYSAPQIEDADGRT